jgi:hypothetical protein
VITVLYERAVGYVHAHPMRFFLYAFAAYVSVSALGF